MYHGSFPADHSAAPNTNRAGRTLLRRRTFLWAMTVFAAGSAAGVLGVGLSQGEAPPPVDDADPATAPERGSLAWALWMVDAPEQQLVAAAGDLERVSARHRDEVRLMPVFEKLLDAAIRSESPMADAAATCAVRSLTRLGRPDLAVDREHDLASRLDFVTAAGALERARRTVRRR